MARIRSIKPEFFTSLTVAGLNVWARLTFIGLWTHVDDHGRCVDDARLIKAAIWPLDDRGAAEVDEDVRQIADAGLIRRYAVGGRTYLVVCGWAEHQRVSHPSKSRIPAPPDDLPTGPRPESGRYDESPEERASIPDNPAPLAAVPPLKTAVASANTDPGDPPENLGSPPEILRPDQGSGIGSGKGKDHHQRARDDTLRLIASLTGADDDESGLLYEKILNKHKPDNPGGYIRTMHQRGHLAAALAEVRDERHQRHRAAIRRVQLAAALEAPEAEPDVTPDPAARSQLRAFLAGAAGPPGGEPAQLGAILGTARPA